VTAAARSCAWRVGGATAGIEDRACGAAVAPRCRYCPTCAPLAAAASNRRAFAAHAARRKLAAAKAAGDQPAADRWRAALAALGAAEVPHEARSAHGRLAVCRRTRRPVRTATLAAIAAGVRHG
jgi:hypothetical protein